MDVPTDFERVPGLTVSAGGIDVSHAVIATGDGPRVVLLHELPGLTSPFLTFARRLAIEHFQVHLPVLYDASSPKGAPRRVIRGVWCLRRELGTLRSGGSAPLGSWVRCYVRKIATDEHRKVGVIGMCFTGGLVLATMAEPATGAVVAAQPSVPLRLPVLPSGSDLDVSDDHLASARASFTPLLATRYHLDPICPPKRLQRIRDEFGKGRSTAEKLADGVTVHRFRPLEIMRVPGIGHSTLTRSSTAFEYTVCFLKTHLLEDS